MKDFEKLERDYELALEHIRYHSCNNCSRYDCKYKPRLGERTRSNCIFWVEECRVMSLEEVEKSCEDRMFCELNFGEHISAYEPLCDIRRLLNNPDLEYGEDWRCWTCKPFDFMEKVTPWE